MKVGRLDDFLLQFRLSGNSATAAKPMTDEERRKAASRRSRAFVAALTGDESVLDETGETPPRSIRTVIDERSGKYKV